MLRTLESGNAQTLTRERLMERLQSKSSEQVVLDLHQVDIALARNLAEEKGLDYRVYFGALLHEALNRESNSAGW